MQALTFHSGLPAKAQGKREGSRVWSRKAEKKKKFWARYLGKSVSLSTVCGQRGCCEWGPIRSIQLLLVSACSGCLLRIAGLCHCRSDVCTWVLATLWGQCVTTPGPTEALLQARLSFPMTAVSGATAALLLYWSILTFNLRWDFKLYLPTSPPFYLFCTNTSFSDKIDKEKYAKKIKIAHLDKHNCRKYTI